MVIDLVVPCAIPACSLQSLEGCQSIQTKKTTNFISLTTGELGRRMWLVLLTFLDYSRPSSSSTWHLTSWTTNRFFTANISWTLKCPSVLLAASNGLIVLNVMLKSNPIHLLKRRKWRSCARNAKRLLGKIWLFMKKAMNTALTAIIIMWELIFSFFLPFFLLSSNPSKVIEAKTPHAVVGVEGEDARVDARCVWSTIVLLFFYMNFLVQYAQRRTSQASPQAIHLSSFRRWSDGSYRMTAGGFFHFIRIWRFTSIAWVSFISHT